MTILVKVSNGQFMKFVTVIFYQSKKKNWDGARSNTRPSNLPDINLNKSELTRDTYLIFC
jgi:hypothetical protein